MTERKWHSGPPPHVGWWNASAGDYEEIWRWWDGECWSDPAYSTQDADVAQWSALCPARYSAQSRIRWTTYWPENARVPRIDPRKETR